MKFDLDKLFEETKRTAQAYSQNVAGIEIQKSQLLFFLNTIWHSQAGRGAREFSYNG